MEIPKKLSKGNLINNPVRFSGQEIRYDFVLKTLDFSYQMVFGEGHHRTNRSGGSIKRKKGELFCNTFQGKLAEYCVYNEFLTNGYTIPPPDNGIYGEGVWDDSDLAVNGAKLNIKSSTFFSNLILLETKDWDLRGNYIPNLKTASANIYDYFILVRIKENIKSIFTKNRLFYSDDIKRETIDRLVLKKWFFDIPGFCTHDTLKYIINKNYVISKNAKLNNTVSMDASNYYIQAGDLLPIEHLVKSLKHSNT
jgi:hypothetical protein